MENSTSTLSVAVRMCLRVCSLRSMRPVHQRRVRSANMLPLGRRCNNVRHDAILRAGRGRAAGSAIPAAAAIAACTSTREHSGSPAAYLIVAFLMLQQGLCLSRNGRSIERL